MFNLIGINWMILDGEMSFLNIVQQEAIILIFLVITCMMYLQVDIHKIVFNSYEYCLIKSLMSTYGYAFFI